jgi:hypothetical protein
VFRVPNFQKILTKNVVKPLRLPLGPRLSVLRHLYVLGKLTTFVLNGYCSNLVTWDVREANNGMYLMDTAVTCVV